MELLRTPDERFAGLPGWSYDAHYAEVTAEDQTARMAYVDEGPRGGRPVLLLHGEPSWSYLYRSMIEPLVAAGLRVIAPDLVGFGRSDKPAAREDYTYARHVGWLTDLVVHHLDLTDVILFGQDWGGLLGLRIAAEQEERFGAIVASNTFLPAGERPLGAGFEAWRTYSQQTPELNIGRIVDGGTARALDDAEIAAYDAPFPDESYKSGARQFPLLVPDGPDDPAVPANRAAWEVLKRWDKPFVCAFGDGDPVTRGADAVLQELIPGAAGQPHVTLEGVAHFSQEDAGPRLAEVILAVTR
ncbi:haloalkane dehalogenase [Baekduia sp.]|uniref:haloalkane dehalogenase n=1 Tax=Baekduia sp. TaxID=2600305 RepID=UPI002E04152F|nr:haloalkane dehalogenase [Baekduia sp.]